MNEEQKARIEELNEQLEEKQEELENYDDEEGFNDALDSEGMVCIGSLEYYPSTVLKEVDPIAYRCGLSDYEDEGRSELENEISDLKNEIEELENEEGF